MWREVRRKMWRKVRSEVRIEKLSQLRRGADRSCPNSAAMREAGLRLVQVYSELAQRNEHLLTGLVGTDPRQWTHYPEDDAIDTESGFQWFYHAHSPEDRHGSSEHGHIHVFARKPLWSRRMCSDAERSFASLCGFSQQKPNSRHLLGIGFDAKGLPINIFTVNSWVTGDLMLSAPLTAQLLKRLRLNTGYSQIDTVIEAIAIICKEEISMLLDGRDQALDAISSPDKLNNTTYEILSEVPVDLDSKLRVIL